MNPGHALNIMLPGSLVGVIVGYAAQKYQEEKSQKLEVGKLEVRS
jgi:hypothetical protein